MHNTLLKPARVWSGLIAELAEPLNEPDAQNHPAFSYRPETGEEIYHSFLGVPILRGGDVLGVLTVQNKRTKRILPTRTSRRCRPRPWCWPRLVARGPWPSANAGAEFSRAVGHAVRGQPLSEGWRSAMWCCTSRASSSPS